MTIAGQRRQRPLTPGDPRQPTAKRQGLDRLQLAQLVARQAGACALCGRPLGDNFAVDHDHVVAARHGHNPSTGCARCIRGAVHHRCNAAIAALGDDPARLRAAARYVGRLRGSF